METRELVIVGGGPGGLTAGLYAARGGMDAVLVEMLSPGGQVLNTDLVENWPGDHEGVTGFDLADRMRRHAEKFGLEIRSGELKGLALEGRDKVITLAEGELRARAVILCLGASPRKLGIPGEEEFTGKGVSYCGTCDGPFYRDQEVVVVGGGDTAAEEAVFLTKFASKVYLVHRRDELRAVKVLRDRVLDNEKIEVLWSHVPLAVQGGAQGVESVRLKDLKSGREFDQAVSGAFIFVGTSPNTEVLRGVVEMDPRGFILADRDQRTSLPGVFAAGDCCSKLLRQIITAAGEGATAAFAAARYLEDNLEPSPACGWLPPETAWEPGA